MSSRVVLIDDHAIVRDGARRILSRAGYDVVGEGATGAEALALVDALAPNVVVLDARLPDMGGLEVLRRMREAGTSSRVLIFSSSSDRWFVSEALSAGASGYVGKTAGPDELVEAVGAVARGESYVGTDGRDVEAAAEVARGLTAREIDIVRLIAEGMSSKEVAAELDISFRTVETHRERILKKLGARNVAGIVRFAITAGLTGV